MLKELVVRVSKEGKFYSDYKKFRIIVKQKNGIYKGKAYSGDIKIKLVPSTNFRSFMQMATNFIDENY